MRLTTAQLRQIIKEEISRVLMEATAEEVQPKTAWMVTKGPIPGIARGQEIGAVLMIKKVENGMANYGVYFPDQAITIKDQKFDNADRAISALGAARLFDEGFMGSIGGERYVLPVEELAAQANKIG